MIPYEECELYKNVNDLGMRIDLPTDKMILAVGARFMSERAIPYNMDLFSKLYQGEEAVKSEMLEILRHDLWSKLLEACGIEHEDLMKLDAVKDIPLEVLLFNQELRERKLLHD